MTEIAQQAWKQCIQKGDCCVDATAGNGRDTLWLSRAVGPAGQVYSMDLQEAAIESTRQTIAQHLSPEEQPYIHYILGCHSTMHEHVGSNKAALICFNLGYLPRQGNKLETATKLSTTVAAIEAALEVIRPGGCISVLCYSGQPGGQEEYEAVSRLAAKLPPDRWICSEQQLLNRPTCPKLVLIWAADRP